MDKKDSTSQVNTLNPDELAEINSQGKRKTPRPLKKLAWWGVLVVPVLVIATYLTVMYVRNKDVYARVGDGVVTKAEYKSARALNEKVAKLTNNETVLKDVDGYTQNQLFVEASLKAEAKKDNVTITDNDLEEQILSADSANAKKMGTPQDTIRNYLIYAQSVYGNDSKTSDIMRPYNIEALKEGLANKIIEYRSILLITTRWDFYSGTTGYTKEQADQLAKQTLETKGMTLMREKKSDEDIIKLNRPFKDGLTGFSPSTLVSSKLEYINKNKKDSPVFQDEADWASVNSLNNVGDYTAVKKSEGGGYYYIMRLSEHGTGSFKTWDDYVKAARSKAVIFGPSFNWRSLIAYNQSSNQFAINNKTDGLMCMEQKQPNFMTRVFGGYGFNDKAMAEEIGPCPVSQTNADHFVSFGGTIRNSLLQPMSNIKVTVAPRGQICPTNQPQYTSAFTIQADVNGHWRSGFQMSCWMPWKLIMTARAPDGRICTMETDLIKDIGMNGHIAKDQDIVFDCIGSDGGIRIEHWVKSTSDTDYHIGQVPQSDINGVNTCIGDVALTAMYNALSCNFNFGDTPPDKNPNPNLPAGVQEFRVPSRDYGVKVAGKTGIQSAPLLASGWAFDHIEVFYPCGGNLKGPWWYPDQVPNIVVHQGCGFDAVSTVVRSYFRQVPPPTVTLTMNGLPSASDPSGSDAAHRIELISDSTAGANLKWTVGGVANSCDASGGWTGQKNPAGDTEDRAQPDSQADDKTVQYIIKCTGPGGSSPESSVWVRYRRRYYPYIKTNNGDVSVTNKITISKASSLADKHPGSFVSTDALAEYVVMSAGSQYFCSVNKMLFGLGVGGNQSYDCPASQYSVKNNPPGSVLSSLQKYAPSASMTCDTSDKTKPYSVDTLSSGTLAGSKDFSESAPSKDCPKVWKYTGVLNISNLTVTGGRATIWVDGDVNITGDININAGPSNNTINTVPNLAIVAKNIKIAPSVTNISASLYAYTTNGSADGKISTCNSGNIATSYPSPNCQQQLNVAGRMGAEGGFELGRNAFTPFGPGSIPDGNDGSGNLAAEFIRGTAQSLIFPPPGFEDRISEDATAVKYYQGELNPRF